MLHVSSLLDVSYRAETLIQWVFPRFLIPSNCGSVAVLCRCVYVWICENASEILCSIFSKFAFYAVLEFHVNTHKIGFRFWIVLIFNSADNSRFSSFPYFTRLFSLALLSRGQSFNSLFNILFYKLVQFFLFSLFSMIFDISLIPSNCSYRAISILIFS